MASSRIFPSLRSFTKPNFKDLQVSYFPGVALFRQDANNLTSNNPVKRLRSKDILDKAQLRPDALRWKVVTHTSSKLLPLSTQRSRLRRRWSSALIGSLRKYHMGPDGKLLEKKDLSRMSGVEELGGTLEILVHRAYGFDLRPADMQKDTDKLIDALLRSGMATGMTSSRELDQNFYQPVAEPITPWAQDCSRGAYRPFDPSRYRPSWSTTSQKL